jgi:hypothetical protein
MKSAKSASNYSANARFGKSKRKNSFLCFSWGLLFASSNLLAQKSEFEVPIELPSCNAANPEVQIIESNEDWSGINNVQKRIFCVKPGDYTSIGSIVLRQSGTATKRRYILLMSEENYVYSDTTQNPANVSLNEQAVVKQLRIINADYWVIDRIVQRGADAGGGYVLGDHNIFNNMLFERAPRFQLVMYNGSDLNVVQYSVCREQTENIDTMCFGIADHIGPDNTIPTGEFHTLGNRFISNEIYDYTDGIQLVHGPGVTQQDMSGTIIDSNDIYITEKRYVDADGKPDPNGDYACAENGIDLKIGGSGPSLTGRVTISNNRIWGMRQSNCPTMSDAGIAISTVQSGVATSYLHIEGNIIFNNARGMMIGRKDNTGIIIKNNIITDSRPPAADPREFGISSPDPSIGEPMLIYGNAISGHYYWTGAEENKDYQCNFILDSIAAGKRTRASGSKNSYFVNDYKSNHIGSEIGEDKMGLPSQSHFEDACFVIQAITNPHVKCLENAVPSLSTPRAEECIFSIPNLTTNYFAPSSPKLISIEAFGY